MKKKPIKTAKLPISTRRLKIAVDGVFFQLYKTGIARVWHNLLEEWVKSNFAQYIIMLDREGTSPKIAGIEYLQIPAYSYSNIEDDHKLLQTVCDQEQVSLFISSYYTIPLSTPSVFMVYDMIPEVGRWDLSHPMWQVKHQALKYSSSYIAISKNTAQDLVNFFPEINSKLVTVACCGVSSIFSPSNYDIIGNFKKKYGVNKPYFLLVGGGGGYKNTILFLKAFSQLPSKEGFDIICTGSMGDVDENWRTYTSGSVFHLLRLSDEDLIAAYSGAIALVFPSQYEGFGLPILESMACGCPVITCPNGSIPEVAGEAVIYIANNDVDALTEALLEVQKPRIRQQLIAMGLERSQQFSWKKMADIVSSVLIETTLQTLNLRATNLIVFPDWSTDEQLIETELKQLITGLVSHPNNADITILIDTGNIDEEDVNLFLSNLVMILMLEDGLLISENLSIVPVGKLADIQGKFLLNHLQGRIMLESDNQSAISQYDIDKIPTITIKEFSSKNYS